ncbi:MAG: FAD-dependent oxidoreductase, partial [Planctomycetota bacterium]
MSHRNSLTMVLSMIALFVCHVARGDDTNITAQNRDPVQKRGSGESEIVAVHDLVIYGGTSAAVAAAVQAKRDGLSVVIVSPDRHLGGLSSGGLGWTDTGNKAVIGGIAREFYARVYDHYDREEAWRFQSKSSYGNRGQGTPAIDQDRRTMWIFEPHVAEQVFESLIRDHGIRVDRDQWLDRQDGVRVRNGHIRSIRTIDGTVYRGRVFVDATYEGDLLAAAGVDYHVGRESTEQYDEKWNGIQTGVFHHRHHFGAVPSPVDAYVVPGDPSSGVIAKVSPHSPGEFGDSDDKIQAYCFRMCLTDHPDNRIPFRKPEGYDPADYELLARIYQTGWRQTFDKFDRIPNRKTDTNNHGPMSTDNIGMNHDYPEASYERRQEIIAEHRRYQEGWFYFICTDPRVPAKTRDAMRRWGLSKDEFTDNGNWPHQIYVREARRLIGEMVTNENHLLKRVGTPKSVGMGSYAMDSHNVQRYVDGNGHVQNEGDIGVQTKGPYKISYDCLTPKKTQCKNLLVPVCVSSSHIAFGSIRMEPVFMILGQSVATAASIAIQEDIAVQDVPYARLREQLLDDGQILETPPDVLQDLSKRKGTANPRSVSVAELSGVVVDNTDSKVRGNWIASRSSSRFVGANYLHDGNAQDGRMSVTMTATIPAAGSYEVRIAYPPHPNRSSRTPVKVHSKSTRATKYVNQKLAPPIDALMISVGRFDFERGESVAIEISNEDADGYVIVDAIQIVPV